MTTVKDLLFANLPMILSVIAALGLWKMGAALIRLFVAKAKALAASTPNKVDDALVDVGAAQLIALAELLETGDVAAEIRKLAGLKAAGKP